MGIIKNITKYMFQQYMEHSKNKTSLCGVLGIMEFMNVPLKMLCLFIPIIMYLLALFGADYFIFPIIPTVIQPVYELGVNILLIVIFVLLMIAVIVTAGRKVYDEETALFVEALYYNLHTNPNNCPAKLYLIYKRTKNGITVRKIYSHETKEAWNERSKEILQKFNAHFVDARFQYAKGNSCIIIMKTAEGIEKPVKTQWHDSTLDKDMEEMDDVATRL